MKCKTVCPTCGEIVRTSSIGGFRHCGTQYNVRSNLLEGEVPKYEKMVKKYAEEDAPKTKTPEKAPEEPKPEEKVKEKVEVKEKPKPIIEEKVEAKVIVKPDYKPPVKRKKKVVKEDKTETSTRTFGFF